jgi:hypothetical protein
MATHILTPFLGRKSLLSPMPGGFCLLFPVMADHGHVPEGGSFTLFFKDVGGK